MPGRGFLAKRCGMGIWRWILPASLGGMLILAGGFASAQVGSCTSLQQPYITCSDISGRNSTIVDSRSRYQGYVSSEEVTSFLNLEDEFTELQFSVPMDPIIAPSRPFRGRGVEAKSPDIFAPMEPVHMMGPIRPRLPSRRPGESRISRPRSPMDLTRPAEPTLHP